MRYPAMILMASLLLAASAPQAPAEKPAATRTRPESVVLLDSPQAARDVCLSLRPTSRVLFEGDAVTRAEAKAAHDERRKQALSKLYRVRVPPQGFVFGAYDAREGKLAVDFRRPLRALYGAVNLAVPSDTEVALPLSPGDARAAVAARKARSASLDISFDLNKDALAHCAGSVATDVYTLSGRVVAVTLLDGMGGVLAGAETPLADSHRELLGGYSGVPTVKIGAVQADDGMDPVRIAASLQQIAEPVRRCYEARLVHQPAAAGVVVLGVAVNATGGVESVNFIADALGDPMLRDCVERAAMKARFQGTKGLFRVPVELTLQSRK